MIKVSGADVPNREDQPKPDTNDDTEQPGPAGHATEDRGGRVEQSGTRSHRHVDTPFQAALRTAVAERAGQLRLRAAVIEQMRRRRAQ